MAGVFFAGQPAVLEIDGRIEKFVDSRWPESRWPTADGRLGFELTADPFSGTNSARFHLAYPDVPSPRINEVIIPTGASRYARGLFLFGREQLAAIAGQVWGYFGDLSAIPPTGWGISNNSAILTIQYDRTASWPMFALPPVRLDATGGNNLWILPLVDVRYGTLKTSITGQSTQGETWAGMVSRINDPEFPIVAGGISARVGVPDRETFDNPGLAYGVAVDNIAMATGKRAVPRLISNNLFCLLDSHDSPSPNIGTEVNLWAGGAVPANVRPSRIRFIARNAIDHSNECRNRHIHDENAPFGDGPLKPTIHSSWFVKSFRERVSGVPDVVIDNPSKLLFEDACDYLAGVFSAWNDQSYAFSVPGILPWQLTGRDDYVSYRVAGSDLADSVSTHVQSLPPNFYPVTVLCQDPSVYVHPTDTAVFRLTAEEDPDRWAMAQIVVADGPYFGADRRETLIKILHRDCLHPLKECDEIAAAYHCSTDLGDGDGLPGWIFNPFTQSLDGWEVEATLDESLTGLDGTGSAEFVKVRSTYPHVLEPPGIDESRKIQFHNPWRVDGVCGSPVILQLVTDACRPPVDGNGEEITSCGYSSDPQPRWEIREAARRKARFILFEYTGGTPTILDFWHGEDPESCGDPVNVVYPLGEPCEPCNVFASYDPHSDVYLAHATRSAMLGDPTAMDVVNAVAYDDTGCAINYVRQQIQAFPCGSEPELGTTEPELAELNVVTNAYLVPPVPACEGYATYTWNTTTLAWELTTPCASGCESTAPVSPPDDPGSPATVQSPCTNPENNPAAPGYLAFTRASILVCGYTAISPATIQLAECEPDPGY